MLEMLVLEPEIQSDGEDESAQIQEGELKYTLMKLQLLGTITQDLVADKTGSMLGLLNENVDRGFPKEGGDKAVEFRQDALAYIDW